MVVMVELTPPSEFAVVCFDDIPDTQGPLDSGSCIFQVLIPMLLSGGNHSPKHSMMMVTTGWYCGGVINGER